MGAFVDPRSCKHVGPILTYRPDKNGNPRYQRQCTNCWQHVGTFIAKEAAAKEAPLETLPLFDEVAQEKAWKNLAQANAMQVLSELRKIQPMYREYLNSPAWHKKRALVLKRANSICEGCGDKPATQVHHLSYDNLGNELLWELVAVCNTCHDRAHPWKFDDESSYAEGLRLRLHRQLENSSLFREQIDAICDSKAAE